jgi:hypothetical protein
VANACTVAGRAISMEAHETATVLDTLWRDMAGWAAAASQACSTVCVWLYSRCIHEVF